MKMSEHRTGPEGQEDEIVVERGSGNVYADLGVEDPNGMALKAGLAMHLHDQIKRLGLTQVRAAAITGISQPDLSRLLRGQFSQFTSDRMVRALTQLSVRLEISVYSAGEQIGDPILLEAAPLPAVA
ncbi:MAG: XRE family transcriptional regulator [Blastomonas sp. CACIA14H2]|nr:MAG: XRE family transcriptional regulator [Blastomonas sp. CACIA14H2]